MTTKSNSTIDTARAAAWVSRRLADTSKTSSPTVLEKEPTSKEMALLALNHPESVATLPPLEDGTQVTLFLKDLPRGKGMPVLNPRDLDAKGIVRTEGDGCITFLDIGATPPDVKPEVKMPDGLFKVGPEYDPRLVSRSELQDWAVEKLATNRHGVSTEHAVKSILDVAGIPERVFEIPEEKLPARFEGRKVLGITAFNTDSYQGVIAKVTTEREGKPHNAFVSLGALGWK